MSDDKKGMRGMMLDPNKATFAVAELCHVLKVAADFSLKVAKLIEEGKYDEAKECALGMGHGLPGSLIQILSDNSLLPEDLPPDLQAQIDEKLMDMEAERSEGGHSDAIKVSLVNRDVAKGKRTLH